MRALNRPAPPPHISSNIQNGPLVAVCVEYQCVKSLRGGDLLAAYHPQSSEEWRTGDVLGGGRGGERWLVPPVGTHR